MADLLVRYPLHVSPAREEMVVSLSEHQLVLLERLLHAAFDSLYSRIEQMNDHLHA